MIKISVSRIVQLDEGTRLKRKKGVEENIP